MTLCPCGLPAALADCCGRYHAGAPAPTPEALMRSRYAAFAFGTPAGLDYLVATHHPDHRDPDLAAGLAASMAGIEAWEGLEVLEAPMPEGDEGRVAFVASYRLGDGTRGTLRERSSFERVDGRWFYTEGVVG